jgi:hypothetical protein
VRFIVRLIVFEFVFLQEITLSYMTSRGRSRSPASGRKSSAALSPLMMQRRLASKGTTTNNESVKQVSSTNKAQQSNENGIVKNSNDSVNYTFVLYAMLAGAFGALSGVAGKLSVTDSVSLAAYFRVATFLANGFCTAQMWRYYLKALSLGSTPTCQVINTATNFVVSAAVGFAVFGEEVNSLWCIGATLVVCGLGLIVSDPGVPQPS